MCSIYGRRGKPTLVWDFTGNWEARYAHASLCIHVNVAGRREREENEWFGSDPKTRENV